MICDCPALLLGDTGRLCSVDCVALTPGVIGRLCSLTVWFFLLVIYVDYIM